MAVKPKRANSKATRGVDGAVGIVPQSYGMVPISALTPHERNVNEGDLGAIIESIDANQFFGAVIAQKSTSKILAGKHRWIAAKDRGLECIPVIWADVDDATALRIMLADNRTARLGADNQAELADLLQSILNDQGSLAGTGYDGDFLDELLADLGQMPENAPAEQESTGASPLKCPACGYEFAHA